MPNLLVYHTLGYLSYSTPSLPVAAEGRVGFPLSVGHGVRLERYGLMSVTVEGVIDIRALGADPTGVADATDVINGAFATAKAERKLVVGYGGTYRIAGTVNVKWHCDFIGAKFVGDSGQDIPVVRIADDDEPYGRLRGLFIRLPRIEKDVATNCPTVGTETTWPNDDDAVLIEGLSRSIVWFDYIGYCRNGIHIKATSETVTGTDFCQFFLTDVNGCQTGLWLDVSPRATEPGDSFGGGGVDAGWINENRFYGGAIRQEGVDGYDVSGVSLIKLTGLGDATYWGRPSHNVFEQISIEGNVHEYSIVCEGVRNEFRDMRWERFYEAAIGGYPEERILLDRPTALQGSTMYAHANVFSGMNVDRLTDPADTYGGFYFGSAMTSAQENWAHSVQQIGRADDEGGGWVKVVKP